MLKKLVLLTVSVLSIISLPAQAWSKDEITMLVVPCETVPIQIAQDISRRYPVLLVSYQMERNKLKINAWNGDGWVYVPVEDYTNGTFFANRPRHTVLVENERFSAPAVLAPNSTWCGSANRLSSTDPRVMLHLLGLSFDFPFRHWNQLAQRYGYTLEEINPTLNNVHWWNLRTDTLLENRATRDFSDDLNYWHYLAIIPAPAIEPILMEEEAPVAAPAAPKKAESGATAVDITAKPPEAPAAEPAPAIEPVAVEEEVPVPAAEPAKPIAQEPVAEPAPVVVPETMPEAAPMAEPTVAIEADPFSAEEIPAAEIVVPQEPKKPWWKIF